MKSKIILLLILTCIVTACTSSNDKKEENTKKSETNNKEESKDKTLEKMFTGDNETFLNEYYINFPEIKNMVHYLGVSPDMVTMMSQTDKKLQFFCTIDLDVDVHDETIISYTNYVKNLEAEGYELTLYDGTVVQEFELTNDTYTINITILSDPQLWKKDVIDTGDGEYENLDMLENENVIFTVTRNK